MANILEKIQTLAVKIWQLLKSLRAMLPGWLKPWLRWGMAGLFGMIVLVSVGLVWALNVYMTPVERIKDGDQAFWKSHLVEAERSYRLALDTAKVNSQKTLAYIRLCRLYRVEGESLDALRMCQAAVQSDPGSALAEAELARVFSALDAPEEAISHGQKACELDETDVVAFLSLAEAMASYEKGQEMTGYSRPLEIAQYAYSLDPANPEVLQVLGFLFQLQGKQDEAYEYFERSRQIEPDFFVYYIDLGGIEQARMNLEASLEYYQRALDLYPQSIPALQGRGWTWSMSGDYEKARQDFLQALRYDSQEPGTWSGLGWVYLRMEDTTEAERAFEQALAIDPEEPNALAGLDGLEALTMVTLAQADVAAVPQEPPSSTVESAVATPDPEVESEPEIEETSGIAQAVSAAVMVYAFNDQMDIVSACSGVIIDQRGVFLTTAHCLGHKESGVLYNGQGLVGIGILHDFRQPPEQVLRAKVVENDFVLDIAVLEVVGDWQGNALVEELNLPALKIGDSDALQVGDEVWTAGFPGMGGETLTITRGVISGFSERDGLSWIKTDLMTGPGNSGGMVLNAHNELIAIHIQSWSDTGEVSSRLSAERPLSAIAYMYEPYLGVDPEAAPGID